jgi:hypothetical protein
MTLIEFTAVGAPAAVSRAIEEYARGLGNISALVVPWESTATTLSMAVTLVRNDGWAIEHTALGTITLTLEGRDRSRLAIAAENADHPDQQKLTSHFDRFARQIQDRLEVSDQHDPAPRG